MKSTHTLSYRIDGGSKFNLKLIPEQVEILNIDYNMDIFENQFIEQLKLLKRLKFLYFINCNFENNVLDLNLISTNLISLNINGSLLREVMYNQWLFNIKEITIINTTLETWDNTGFTETQVDLINNNIKDLKITSRGNVNLKPKDSEQINIKVDQQHLFNIEKVTSDDSRFIIAELSNEHAILGSFVDEELIDCEIFTLESKLKNDTVTWLEGFEYLSFDLPVTHDTKEELDTDVQKWFWNYFSHDTIVISDMFIIGSSNDNEKYNILKILSTKISSERLQILRPHIECIYERLVPVLIEHHGETKNISGLIDWLGISYKQCDTKEELIEQIFNRYKIGKRYVDDISSDEIEI